MVFGYLPESLMLEKPQNLAAFAAVLAFDKWTGNADGRQAFSARRFAPESNREYICCCFASEALIVVFSHNPRFPFEVGVM